jgi:hypothetical protein
MILWSAISTQQQEVVEIIIQRYNVFKITSRKPIELIVSIAAYRGDVELANYVINIW